VHFSSAANRAVIENSTFNRCASVYLDNSSSVEITSLEITNVISGTSGLYARSSTNGNIDIDKIKIENIPNGRGMEINTAGTVMIFNAGIRNTKTTANGGGLWINRDVNLFINETVFEDCIAYNNGGAIFKSNSVTAPTIINSRFIDCTARNRGKIIYCEYARGFTSIIEVKYCTFTHTSALRDVGEFDSNSYHGMFLYNGYFEACTFNNLTSNTIHEYYLFGNLFKWIDDGTTSLIGSESRITLKDCIFNFKNTGKLGLIAMHNNNVYDDNILEFYMIIDNITINNYNGLQPLIWLYRSSVNSPSDIFKFTGNNVYNGTLLDTQQKNINLGSNIVRLQGGAVPTLVP